MTKLYINTIESLMILGLAVMVALTFTSTAIRFVPGYGGIFWAEEVTRYVSIWVVFLGAGLGVRFGIHLSVDLIVAMLPGGLARALLLASFLLMLVFEAVLVWYGTSLTISNHAQQSASLRMPMSYAYASIPVGGLIMFCETVRLIVREIRGQPREHSILAD